MWWICATSAVRTSPRSITGASATRARSRTRPAKRILQHPRSHIPDWVIEAAIDTVEVRRRQVRRAPAYINPVRAKFSCQVHHVDLDYYRKFHAGGAEPYLATPQLLSHFSEWHPGMPDLYQRTTANA